MEVVAVHDRFAGKGKKYITIQDHLASQHKYLAEWNPQKFMNMASAIDEAVTNYIAKIFSGKCIQTKATNHVQVF
jgi:hypothetical protein